MSFPYRPKIRMLLVYNAMNRRGTRFVDNDRVIISRRSIHYIIYSTENVIKFKEAINCLRSRNDWS